MHRSHILTTSVILLGGFAAFQFWRRNNLIELSLVLHAKEKRRRLHEQILRYLILAAGLLHRSVA